MIEEAIKQLSEARDLTENQMYEVMEEILSGKAATPRIIDFLVFLSKKGESVEEVTAAVRAMREHVTRIKTKKEVVLDTCGTGGDRKGTVNVSTAVAFVAAGSGITVAKHGNRSVSSASGSADVLEKLGVNINLSTERIESCLDEVGIAFLFAQALHPAMKYAMPARKQIGDRTIFNILGPLTNPAGARHQLVGVYDLRWIEILARVLGSLGSRHVLVVHGEDGLDEITTTAKTRIAESCGGKIKVYDVEPSDFGFKKAKLEDLKGLDAGYNASIILDVLRGKGGPVRDIVVLNAAAAIYAADKAKSIKEGIGIAAGSIDSGNALKKLEQLKEYSIKYAKG